MEISRHFFRCTIHCLVWASPNFNLPKDQSELNFLQLVFLFHPKIGVSRIIHFCEMSHSYNSFLMNGIFTLLQCQQVTFIFSTPPRKALIFNQITIKNAWIRDETQQLRWQRGYFRFLVFQGIQLPSRLGHRPATSVS